MSSRAVRKHGQNINLLASNIYGGYIQLEMDRERQGTLSWIPITYTPNL